jgi:polysaccharide biosynthesis protein PslH
MKVLFVSPWVPSPIRPRSFALLQMLTESNDVRFLALARHRKEERSARNLPTPQRLLVRNRRIGSMVRTLRALPAGVSLQQGYASPPGLVAAFQRELRDWRPDIVHLNVFRTVHLVEACGPVPVVVDLDEFRSEYYDQLAAHGSNAAWRLLGRIEGPRMRAREEALRRMGVPLMLSAQPSSDEASPPTYVVRSPCDLPLQRRGAAAAPTVLFVGRLTYEANVAGLEWFVRECWPAVRRRVPDARLRVVGSGPPRRVRSLAGRDIEVFGDVPSTEPHYADATVAVVPIFRGSGVQMKLIQALAAGVPAVTTADVAARAGVRHGEHVLVATESEQWAAAIAQVIDGQGPAERLVANGRRWAVANHGTAAVRGQLGRAYAAALAARTRAALADTGSHGDAAGTVA